MSQPPAFQLYADDLISGTMKFSDAELGLYMRLLCAQWNEGSLPDDDNELLTYGKGKTPLSRVKEKFNKCPDGRLRNARMEKVRQEQEEFRESKEARGRAGANARWGKQCSSNAQASPKQCQQDAKAMLEHCPTDTNAMLKNSSPVSSLQSPSKEIKKKDPERGSIYEILKLELEDIYGRKPGGVWTSLEEFSLFEISSRPEVEDEFRRLKKFKSTNPTFPVFPQSVEKLLRDWSSTVDRATAVSVEPSHRSCIAPDATPRGWRPGEGNL